MKVFKTALAVIFLALNLTIAHSETLNPKMSYSLEDLANNEHTYPYQPVYQPLTKNAFTLYSAGFAARIPVIEFYVVGETTNVTVTNTYQIYPSSIGFIQTGGLYAGTTYWDFADHRTLTESVNYLVNIGTSVPGIWGGIVISTKSPNYGVWASTRLAHTIMGLPVNCRGTEAKKTLYISTSGVTDTVQYGVFTSSFEIKSGVNSLTRGTTGWNLVDYTIRGLINVINGMNAYAPGAEGGLVAVPYQGTYLDDNASVLGKITFQSIYGAANTKTVTKDDTQGMTYILPVSSLTSTQQYRVTDASINATFGSGTCYIKVYDGVSSTNTVIRKEKISTSAYDAKMDIGENGDFCGSVYTPIRFDVYNSTSMTDGWLNLDVHKR